MPYLEKNIPISNKSHIGIASNIWDTTSGGVNNIPKIKANIITYERFSTKSFLSKIPTFIKKYMTKGI